MVDKCSICNEFIYTSFAHRCPPRFHAVTESQADDWIEWGNRDRPEYQVALLALLYDSNSELQWKAVYARDAEEAATKLVQENDRWESCWSDSVGDTVVYVKSEAEGPVTKWTVTMEMEPSYRGHGRQDVAKPVAEVVEAA